MAQASDGGSTTASTSGAVVPRKSVDNFPTSGVPPLSNGSMGLGGSLSPVPSNTGPGGTPTPSPASAALPPPSLPPPYTTTPLQVRLFFLTKFCIIQRKQKSTNERTSGWMRRKEFFLLFNCSVDYSFCSPSENFIMLFPWCAFQWKSLLF